MVIYTYERLACGKLVNFVLPTGIVPIGPIHQMYFGDGD
jgi:hypothetical protein